LVQKIGTELIISEEGALCQNILWLQRRKSVAKSCGREYNAIKTDCKEGIIMENRPVKKASESFTTQVQVLTLANLNGYNRLFGGQLMSWMDITAAVAARRHSGRNVTTVKVEALEFRAPAHANDTLVLTAGLVSVGNSSMRVKVDAYVEGLDGSYKHINEAYFIMVALDDNEKPTTVPLLQE